MLKLYMLVYVCERDIVNSCTGTFGCMRDQMVKELLGVLNDFLGDEESLKIADALSKKNWDDEEIRGLPYFNDMWGISGDSAWCNFGHNKDWAILEV